MTNTLMFFDFNKESDISKWLVIDDVVMGGRSKGSFNINSEGFGVFEGLISLENNGGFSSLKYQFKQFDISKFKKIKITLKGDGKKYQLRLKSEISNRYAYATHFQTTTKLQTIEFLLTDFKPTFRGEKLNLPDYSGLILEEIGFLLGNKQNELFKLLIASIAFE